MKFSAEFFFKMSANGKRIPSPYHQAKNILCGQKLRRIGKDMELPFGLSFHLSRHTFATNALNNGMRIEYVSKLLDHSDIGITQIYGKVISEELDKAVELYIN